MTAILARHGLSREFSAEQTNYFPTPAAYSARLKKQGFEIEEIQLIPRPTPLGETGMHGWLTTFRRGVLESIPEELRQTVLEETVALLEPALRDEQGNWTADYVRLRFLARA